MRLLDGMVELQPEGYAVDRRFPDIYYVPEDAEFSVATGNHKLAPGRRHGHHSAARPGGVYFLPIRLPRLAGQANGRDGVAPGGAPAARYFLP